MSKKNYTHIVVVLDRSGSMAIIEKDMKGGFNNFVKEQKEVEGEATLTLAQFDDKYEIVHNNIPIAEVPNLILQPRGSTALLDAMGKTLNSERDRIKEMDEDDAPEKVIVVIITDGEENCSREYSRDQVFEMIKSLQEDEDDPQWDFVFLGANQDAIASGGSIGVRSSSALTYDYSDGGTDMAFKSLSKSMTSYRMAKKGISHSFSEEDREEQEKLMKKSSDKFNKAIPTYITDLNDNLSLSDDDNEEE